LKEHSIKLFRSVNHYSEITYNVTASDFTATLLRHKGKFFRSVSKCTVRCSLT